MRQYTFVAQIIGALPPASAFARGEHSTDIHAQRAADMTGLAAETFNDGLRAYYFSFAAMGWFFSPLVFVFATLMVVAILYSREFRSEVLDILKH
jgi:uncharacterized membrane protein